MNDTAAIVATGMIVLCALLYIAYSIGRAVERDEALSRAERQAKRAEVLDRIYRRRQP